MIGKMAIATALGGFNDLGQSMTRERRKLKKFQDLSTGHPILPYGDCKVRETMVAKFKLVL